MLFKQRHKKTVHNKIISIVQFWVDVLLTNRYMIKKLKQTENVSFLLQVKWSYIIKGLDNVTSFHWDSCTFVHKM